MIQSPERRSNARRFCGRLVAASAAFVLMGGLSASAEQTRQKPATAAASSAGAEDPFAALSPRLFGLDAWICGAPQTREAAAAPGLYDPSAADDAAPWAAKLEIVEERFADGGMTISNCSAAAIAPNWLLTAAHCVGQEGWVSVRATLGARDAGSASALRRRASLALCHEKFDPRDLSYDLALLRLDTPLPNSFPLLRLADEGEAARLAVGDKALSAGWGRVSSSEISQTMRKASVRIVDPSRRGDRMIVAAPERHEQSLCVGESGAPLVADFGEGPALVGVFSSVDAYVNRRTGEMVELCEGFEARSYFTALRGLQGWVERAISVCESDPLRCAPL